VLAIGFLLLVSLAISAALTALGHYFDRIMPGLEDLLRVAHLMLAFGITTVLFAMMFKILPDVDVEWRDVWLGAATTAFLFTIGKFLIGLYIGGSKVATTYGAAGALVIILLWVYYSAQILLYGAEFAKAYGDARLARAPPAHPNQ
jgi:membrane protein